MPKLKRKSQNEAIKEYLEAGNRLTTLDAVHLFGCVKLGSRISDLRNVHGVPVADRWIKLPNGKRVKSYYIQSAKEKP